MASSLPYLLQKMVEATGGVTIREIAIEFFGEVTPETLYRTRIVINNLRKKLLKKGIRFYAINGVHQFLDKDNYVSAVSEKSSQAVNVMKKTQEMIIDGILQFPNYTDDLLKIAQRTQRALSPKHTLHERNIRELGAGNGIDNPPDSQE